MERTLALHFSSLGKGETPSFRIPPVTERGRAGILERGRLLDLVASPRPHIEKSSPNWDEFRQAPLSAIYEPEISAV
jgi:hypothetical protein